MPTIYHPSIFLFISVFKFFFRFLMKSISEFFFAEHPNCKDTYFIQYQKWNSHKQLVNNIRGRGQDCGNYKIYQDCIFSVLVKKRNINNTDLGKKNHEYRQFKYCSKGNQQPE